MNLQVKEMTKPKRNSKMQEFRTVKDLAEKRHVVKLMIQDAKEYREAGMEEKAVVLESLKGLVFGKVTMQENPENRK